MFFIFGLSYLMGSIGLIGTGLIITEFIPTHKEKLTTDLVYREYLQGNTFSYSNQKRIEIHTRPAFLPIIEWPVLKMTYNEATVCDRTPLSLDYYPGNKLLILKNDKLWSDTLQIK